MLAPTVLETPPSKEIGIFLLGLFFLILYTNSVVTIMIRSWFHPNMLIFFTLSENSNCSIGDK